MAARRVLPGSKQAKWPWRGLALACTLALLALVSGVSVNEAAYAQFRSRGGGRFGGPRGGFGGPQALLSDPNVQQELKLTDAQRQQIAELAREIRPDFSAMMPLFQQLRAAEDEAERQRLRAQLEALQREQQAKIRQTLYEKLKGILSAEQLARFRQIELRNRGAQALLDDDVAQALKLSEQQRERIQAIREEVARQRDAIREKARSGEIDGDTAREQIEQLQREQDERILAVLDASQRALWQQQVGPPLAANEGADGRPGDSAPASESPQPARPAALADPAAVVAQRVDAGGKPVSEPVVAEFRVVQAGVGARPEHTSPDASAADPPGGTGNDRTAEPASGASEPTGEGVQQPAPAGGEKRVMFNFQHAPWADVLKLFADLAGLTLDLNQVPPGTFSFHSNRSYTITEALDVLNGYLLQKGYVLVRRDEFLVVVNLDQGVPPNLIPTVSIDELPKRGRNELMTIIIPLQGVDAVETANEIQNLLGPQGKVVPLSKTNQLVVTDIGANLQKIYQLLSSRSEVDSTVVFRAFEVRHIPVADAERLIRQLFGLQVGVTNVSEATRSSRDPRSYYRREGGGPSQPETQSAQLTGPVQLAADERTNRLLVTAKLADLRIIEETLKSIDVEISGSRMARRSGPYLEVYQLESADALEVSKTLTVLFPGVVVNEDGRAKRLHIYADEETQRQVAEVIRRLDGAGGGTTVEVIPLRRMDPLTAASTLQSLFAAEGQEAPTIQPHPTGTALLVRGTADQVQQIRLLMAQMDPEDGNSLLGRGRVRSVPLGGRDARQVLQLMQQVWEASQPNPIRVVVPADSGPIRERRIPSLPERPQPAGDEGRSEPAAPKTQSATPTTRIAPAQRPVSAAGAGKGDGSLAATAAVALEPRHERRERPASHGSHRPRPHGTEMGVRFASQRTEQRSSGPADAQAASTAQPKTAVREQNHASTDEGPSAPRKAPIVVTPTDSGLIIASDDEAALDRFEAMLRDLSMTLPAKTGWTVFYLRSADATEAAAMLERLLPSANVATPSTSSGGGGLFGGLGAGLADFGRNLLDVTGLNNLGGSALQLRIIPEPRSNALFVSGPPDQVREVEELLRVIDASELPEQLRARTPRMIAVEHADVEQVAAILRDVFREEMSSGRGGDQGRGGNPFAALLGGGRSGSDQRRSEARLTIGVDTKTNHLVVSADEQLYRQVEALVRALDQAAAESQQTVRIVQLRNSNSAVLQQALVSLMPKVNVRSSGGERAESRGASGNATPSPSGSGREGPPPEAIRQFFEQRIRERIMQGLGGGGRPGGGPGASPGGPGGFQGRPGGFFGRPGGGPPGGGRFGSRGGR